MVVFSKAEAGLGKKRATFRLVLASKQGRSHTEGLSALQAAAASFLFCSGSKLQVVRVVPSVTWAHKELDWDDEDEHLEDSAGQFGPSRSITAALCLPPVDLKIALASLLPFAVASHAGLLTGGACMACLPMMVPFSVPNVPADFWLANKRARAFHRLTVICVYLQGAATIVKFAFGDLIGGTYMGVQTAMGYYAMRPEGTSFFPMYIMICGFNGVLGLFQCFQQFQGVPIHFLPLAALGPPCVSLIAALCGWQFCNEIRAIAAGLPGSGSQDSCLVRIMGGDWWPSSFGPNYNRPADDTAGPGGVTGLGGVRNRFSAFAGDGRRLGEA